jgi:hypothetical protein
VGHAHALVIGILDLQPSVNLFRRPVQNQFNRNDLLPSNPLTTEQIKEQVAKDPELTESDRRQMLSNLRVMVLANNRRVDVSLNTTGQQSTHRYPFNAKDYLALISTKGGEKKPPVKKRP